MEYLFFGLLGIGYVFLGPIAFFLTLGARKRLDLAERKVRAMEVRLADAERMLSRVQRSGPGEAAGEDVPVAPQTAPEGETPAQIIELSSANEPAQTEPLPGGQPPPEQPPATSTEPLPGGEPPRAEVGASQQPSPPPQMPDAAAYDRQPSQPRPSLEERLGTRWAVWVGGLALAVGALLLVRQALIQGFFGPGVRIAFGLLFSAALVAAGEWMRRREKNSGDVAQATDRFSMGRPSIPAMLTAAGTIGLFGSIYAAHALYDFIGPATTFVALGVIGVATMFAAALHGPMLAGLGLVGALGTPLLISSGKPSPWPVVIYVAVVCVAAYALARLRGWLWLALASATGAALWGLALMTASGENFAQASQIHAVLHVALALFIFCYEPWRNTAEREAKIDPLASVVTLGAGMFALLVVWNGTDAAPTQTWLACAFALVALLAASGIVTLPAMIGSCVAGALAVMTLVIWRNADDARATIGAAIDFPLVPHSLGAFAAFAFVTSLGIAVASAWRVLRGPQLLLPFAATYAAVAVLTPLLALIVAYLRITAGATSTYYASLAAGLAVGFTVLAHLFRSGVREGEPAAWNVGLGIFASGAIGALALGFVMVLDGGALTVALALAALGAAFVSVRLDIPALRWCVVGLGVAVAARYAWEPRISSAIGTTPILNWLLFGYGIPALAFGYAARLMRLARGEDLPVRIAQALAIMCSALLVFFEIRHFINGGDPYARTSKTIEVGLFAIASLSFALVLMRLDLRRHSIVMNVASYIFGVVTVAIAGLGLGLLANPLFASRANPVEGGPIFNALLLAYLLPGALALLIGRLANGFRPQWYVIMMRVLAVALIFGYLTLQVRRGFQGPSIHLLRATSDGEWYAYSIAWLAFGVALLAYGLWRQSVEVRIASALFIVLSVLKVFLFDLSGLEGVLRALSFIGLGLVLIGIGLVYQKFVFVRKQGPAQAAEAQA
jgi:uncharacterized membrane protein